MTKIIARAKQKIAHTTDPYPDPSLSDSSSNKSILSNDSSYSKSRKNKRNKMKNHQKYKKMTFQTHHQATIIIHPKIVITDSNNARGRAITKRI